jgi:lipoyl-dependent peroxiredoxin
MPIAERSAEITWSGTLARGEGTVAGDSGAFTLPVSWAARTEAPGGKTSPEELVAAAHASCYSMALSGALGRAGNPPESLVVRAVVTLDDVGGAPTVVTSALNVRGRVPGITPADFERIAHEAGAGCPISRLLTGATISVEAELEAE